MVPNILSEILDHISPTSGDYTVLDKLDEFTANRSMGDTCWNASAKKIAAMRARRETSYRALLGSLFARGNIHKAINISPGHLS